MNVTVNLRKFVIVAGVLLLVGSAIWWFVSTKDARVAKAEYKQLVRFANRQEVEIAVIRQAQVLRQLKTAIRRTEKQAQQVTQKQLTDIQEKTIGN